MTVPGAVDALRALARTEALVAPGLRHVEMQSAGCEMAAALGGSG